MGDVGSTFLGAVFAGLVTSLKLDRVDRISPHCHPCWLMLSSTSLAVYELVKGYFRPTVSICFALHQARLAPRPCILAYITATAVLAVAMLAGGWPWVFGLAVVELLVGVWLDRQVAVPFAVASQS